MANRFLTPKSACVFTSSGSMTGGYVWFGLTGASDGAACAAFYRSGSPTAGRQLWTLAVASQGPRSTPMVGPFNTGGSGVYVALTGTRASALVAFD